MHQEGPLARDGILSFWVRGGSYVSYLAVMFFVVRAALARHALEQVSAPGAVA